MSNRMQLFLGRGIREFRSQIIHRQWVILLVLAAMEFLVSLSYVISVIFADLSNSLTNSSTLWIYLPMIIFSGITLVMLPVMHSRNMIDKYWRFLEIWAYALLTFLPLWSLVVISQTKVQLGYVNEIHWAICIVCYSCIFCMIPMYAHIGIVGTTVLFIILAQSPVTQTVNYIVLSVAVVWASSTRFRDSYYAFQLNKSKDLFIARVTHEIRTPVNAINGINEMILRESTEDQIRNYAADIKDSGELLLQLVNDILDVSRLEAGKMAITEDDYSLRAMVQNVEHMIRQKAEEENLLLEVAVDENLPDNLYGDDVRIKQVLLNLLSNAVKYTNEGLIRLEVSGKVEGDVVNLTFRASDTGIGISKAELKRLTEDFYRVENTRNRKVEGTGLGLYIVKSIVDALGGRIKMDSNEGEGSVFKVYLTQKISKNSPKVIPSINEISGKYVPLLTAPDARVLLVDDNRVNIKVIHSLLKNTEIQITDVLSAEAMFDLLIDHKYDLIFLDDLMPEMNGTEAIGRLRELPDFSDVPVIAMTANEMADGYEYYVAYGFTDYLSKPVSPKRLESILVQYLPQGKIKSTKEMEQIS